MTKQTVTHASCPDCGCIEVAWDMGMGEVVCCSCGLVIRDIILEQGPEWRAFTPEERKSRVRVGIPTKYSYFDKGLSTAIRVGRDAFGRPLSPKVGRQMWRLRKWQIRSQMWDKGRNLMKAMDEIQRLSEKLHIPSAVQEMAAVIYRKALDKNLVQGRSGEAIVAGSLYAACRFHKTPRTLNEITEVSPRTRKEISRAYRIIMRNLEMKTPVNDPLEYVTKIAEKAGVSSDVEGLTFKIIRDAKNKKATIGKDPSSIAAAALYIASKLKKEKITQKKLAEAADVTEVTIRIRTKDLMKTLDITLD